jgi:putative transposase
VTSSDEQARRERTEKVAYWRYQLIRDAADPGLSPRARGRVVRGLAESVHTGPFGTQVRVSRPTLDRWIRAWREGGFDALLPPRRQCTPRTPVEVLDLAAALKREQPDRTAAQVVRILRAHSGWAPSERTLLRHFERLELNTRPDGTPPTAFGRFEASEPNDRWVGDALHGPVVAGRKTYLFCFLDDHSRAVMGAEWGHFEDIVRLAAALRRGLAARGVPKTIYVDNGSAFTDDALKKAAAKLGIRIIHSTPYRPQGKGKIERFFETVRGQFLVEVTAAQVADLAELNKLFQAWVETVYHRRVHEGTGQAPLERWLAGAPFPQPTAAQLHEAFLWTVTRQVRKTATVSLFPVN